MIAAIILILFKIFVANFLVRLIPINGAHARLKSVRFIEPGDPDGGPCGIPLFVYDERHARISAELRKEWAAWAALE